MWKYLQIQMEQVSHRVLRTPEKDNVHQRHLEIPLMTQIKFKIQTFFKHLDNRHATLGEYLLADTEETVSLWTHLSYER